MQQHCLWLAAVLCGVALTVSACGGASSGNFEKQEPAVIVTIDGSDAEHVLLTADAARRLDIQTLEVREERVGQAGSEPAMRMVIPYSAVFYDLDGTTFTYIEIAPLTFTRAPIDVDYIEGDLAVLNDGPSLGTAIVVVGAAELYGVESGVGD